MSRTSCAVRMESDPSPVATPTPAGPQVAPPCPVPVAAPVRVAARRRGVPDRRFERWLLATAVLLACMLAAILVNASWHVVASS